MHTALDYSIYCGYVNYLCFIIGHQYLGDSMEHDGSGDEKVLMRHGNLGGNMNILEHNVKHEC